MKRLFLFLVMIPLLATAGQLPIDSAVTMGKLPNGLTYYICPNPGTTADFYIVQRVGSILEEEHQRGLAHFLEHMAFNGTKHFPGKSMIEYLEQNGLRFGNDINAYTSFDETVYNISNAPVDRQGVVDTCLLILHDWSGFITLDGREIDAERKVIHEEWRSKRGVRDRIYEQTLPKLFPDSCRYAYRMPIGLMEVVDNFPHKVLRDYYKRWYRPDLQAIIIAGNIDAADIEKKIKKLWSDLPLKKNVPARKNYTVADNQEPIVAIGCDPELSSGMLRISFKFKPSSNLSTIEGQREEFERNMLISLLANRMADIRQSNKGKAGIQASFTVGDYSIARTMKAFSAVASFEKDNWRAAMQDAVYHLKCATAHGFSKEELERARQQLLAYTSSVINSSNPPVSSKSTSIQRCIAHFLHQRPLLSTLSEAQLYHKFAESISLADLNSRLANHLYTQNGVAILLQMPSGAPAESEVVKEYGAAWSQETVAHQIPQKQPRPVLMPEKPKEGRIIKEKYNKLYDATELLLSNGARVVIKSNAAGRNEFRLNAVSLGGTSLMDDADYNNFSAINSVPQLGGLSHLSGEQLGLALEGSSAAYQTNISAIKEMFSGSCKPSDVEHLMQLLYLRFTTTREDTASFRLWQKSKRSSLEKQINNPMAIYADTLRQLMYQPHPRSRKVSLALADSVDYSRTCQLFRERFANAADFSFVIVGNFNADSLRPLICQYIASLPSLSVKEKPNSKAVPQFSEGSRVCRFAIPMAAPRTSVIYNITEKCSYNPRNNIACAILNHVMDNRCTETLREKDGGTYSVSVVARVSREPQEQVAMMFNFTTNPQQATGLLDKARNILSDIAENGITDAEMQKACQYLQKQHSEYRVTNAFWLSAIAEHELNKSSDLLQYNEALRNASSSHVKNLARKLLRSKHTVQLIMDGEQY